MAKYKSFKYRLTTGDAVKVKITERDGDFWIELDGDVYVNAIVLSDGRIYGCNARKYSVDLTQLMLKFRDMSHLNTLVKKPSKNSTFIKRIK